MRSFLLIVLASGQFLSRADAQPALPTLSLDEAVARALATHPALAVQSQRIQTAAGLAQQAGLRPNPRLILQSENWSFSGAPQQGVGTFVDQFLYGSQVLETGGKRQRRVDLSVSNQRASELDRDVVARQIAGRVKAAYWAALGAQRVYQLLQDSIENFRQTVEYHENQVREGAIAEADLIRVRIEAERVGVAAESAALDAERARIVLYREMGQSEFPAVRLTETFDLVPPLPPADVTQALENRAEVRLARQGIAQAEANLRLQQAGIKPDVETVAGYKRTSGYNTMLWGVQFNLPFQNRNQGNIAAAGSEIKVAQSSLAAVEAQVRAEVQAAEREVLNRRRQLTDLLSGTLARADQALQIARAAYREGGTDLLRLLDAERLNIELRVLNARTLAEYRQSVVALETALGGN